jgi:hypothetical protein
MAGARELQVTVAALVFTTREKDYGGVHLGVGAADATRLQQLLESISRAQPGHTKRLAIGRDAAVLAEQIFPRGRFSGLTSLRLLRADRVRVSVEARAGTVELTASAARAVGDRVAMAHTTGGDSCIVGDSGAWTDRLWIWPL